MIMMLTDDHDDNDICGWAAAADVDDDAFGIEDDDVW